MAQVENPGFSPKDEVTINRFVDIAFGLKDTQLSLNCAVAMAFLKEGRERLLQADKFYKGEGSVLTAPEPSSFLGSLSADGRMLAIEGAAFLLEGSFRFAAEQSKRTNKWEEQVYKAYFNEHRKGTFVPEIPDDWQSKVSYLPRVSPEQELERVKKIIEENESNPFQDDRLLPLIIRAHLIILRGIEGGLVKTSPLFVESVKRLREWVPEKARADEYQPQALRADIADFLREAAKDF